jgi:hypothetical protein
MSYGTVVLSPAERKFIQDLLEGKIEGYEYHYRKMLRKRILDKRKRLTEDLYLISQAEGLLSTV